MNLSDKIEIVDVSDVGKRRPHNEDSTLCDLSAGLVILADGMGRYKAGVVGRRSPVISTGPAQARHTSSLLSSLNRKVEAASALRYWINFSIAFDRVSSTFSEEANDWTTSASNASWSSRL